MPEACMAANTVVPTGTLSVSSACRSTAAYTTSTQIIVSAMQLFGSLAKGIDQGVGCLVEQGTQSCAHDRAGVVERQIQADLAGLVAQCLERPDTVQLTERAFFKIHLDGLTGRQGIARDEMLAQTAFGDLHPSPHGGLTLIQDCGPGAPRQKFRVAGHIVDQVIQSLSGIRQQGRTVNMRSHVSVISKAERQRQSECRSAPLSASKRTSERTAPDCAPTTRRALPHGPSPNLRKSQSTIHPAAA